MGMVEGSSNRSKGIRRRTKEEWRRKEWIEKGGGR